MGNRLRIGVQGKLFGIFTIRWTLVSLPLSNTLEEIPADWLQQAINGKPIEKCGIKGTMFVEVTM